MYRVSLLGEPEAKPSPEVLVLTGPSGAGKGTVGEKLMEYLAAEEPEWEFSRSWTTRPIRPGEDPRSYNFVTPDAFKEKIGAGGFLEHTEFNGNFYGTPVPADSDRKLLVEIEVKGAVQVYDHAAENNTLHNHLFVYILTRNALVLATRLFARGDNMPDKKKVERMATFYESELDIARSLPFHVVINDKAETAAHNIIGAMHGNFFCPPDLDQILPSLVEDGKVLVEMARRLYSPSPSSK